MNFCHGDRMRAELPVKDSPRGDHRPPNHSSPESELSTSHTTEPATRSDRFVAAAIGSGRPDLPRWSLEVHPAVITSMFCAASAALVLFYVVDWRGPTSFERLERPATTVFSLQEAARLGHFPAWASRPPGRYTTPRTTQIPLTGAACGIWRTYEAVNG
jgi:hypothetical protein